VLPEYVLPEIGKRIDCVLIAQDVLFVIEYKAGQSTSGPAAVRQARNDVVNLADFHEHSCERGIYSQAALSCVVSASAKGRVKKNELPLPNWLSAQMCPP